MVADAVAGGLDAAVAVRVIACCCEIALGAVYCPLEVMLPTFGLIDHCTLPVPPPTVAVNCWAWEACSVTCAGITTAGITATGCEGTNVMEA
jgi:hypothetical protein